MEVIKLGTWKVAGVSDVGEEKESFVITVVGTCVADAEKQAIIRRIADGATSVEIGSVSLVSETEVVGCRKTISASLQASTVDSLTWLTINDGDGLAMINKSLFGIDYGYIDKSVMTSISQLDGDVAIIFVSTSVYEDAVTAAAVWKKLSEKEIEIQYSPARETRRGATPVTFIPERYYFSTTMVIEEKDYENC